MKPIKPEGVSISIVRAFFAHLDIGNVFRLYVLGSAAGSGGAISGVFRGLLRTGV